MTTNNLRTFLLTLLVSTLSSCSMVPMMVSPDLSRQEPYKTYVGKTVYLKQDKPLWLGGGSYDGYPYTISSYDPQGGGLSKVTLKKGQPFVLDKVKHYVGAGVSRVCLLGAITVRGTEYKVEVSHGNYPYRFETELPFTNQPD